MERFVIQGGARLRGEVEVSGAKNSALKLAAAALLAPGRTLLHNVPRIRDMQTMLQLLDALGAEAGFEGDTLEVDATGIDSYTAPYELVRQMRASIIVLGPLVARFGRAEVSAPGGCNLGLRKFNFHLDGLRALGAEVEVDHGFIKARAPEGLRGAEVYFEYPSVGATENVMMAAVRARGITIIENAAREPEIVALADFLNGMGASVMGAGTGRIVVEGVEELEPVEWTVIPDRIEAGTFLMAAAATGGEVLVRGARPEHLKMELEKLHDMGVELELGGEGILVREKDPAGLRGVDVSTLPFPGFATDLQTQMMVLLTQASGCGIITENVYENRLQVAEELNRMGAGIDLFGGHRALVRGPRRLSGTAVQAPDLRGGAALVMAGLVAEGTTVVDDARHILRGYERFEEKLAALGAAVAFESGASVPR
ncbi:UDP-N-acetylglucosamine 1-carboxyvinyltransferase 1 [Rubrobacter xylanophilus DSM 9941]|uniref:UDP-N-acetylglucosamine 1-carboxyvinyltransferase n=1 Tax=Rubrobacter xylanophilus TaxID=49319 RepID=UPI001C6434AD|nr:UDP-N-acetylglucosamine 1-carboxyvinyltransferase [Rubrobacter xylanophilus]QYJ14906.1 UDP-N-acetylglucosamine 1-carboxyvinyltransferase 1 [Rubrobacter xylanophilus DSM 9941]